MRRQQVDGRAIDDRISTSAGQRLVGDSYARLQRRRRRLNRMLDAARRLLRSLHLKAHLDISEHCESVGK